MTNLTATPAVLVCQDIAIQRGEFVLCEGVNLTLYKGEICHIIGENGTGKTTFLMQLAGLLPTETGEVFYQGEMQLPVQPLYIAHQVGIHLQLSVEQNLRFLLALYGINPSDDELAIALDWVGLSGYEGVACYQLSAGQTRRVGLARLYFYQSGAKLVAQCPFWLLDEPLTALDVAMIAKVEAIVQDFARQGGTVLMTSHQAVTVANRLLDLTEFMV